MRQFNKRSSSSFGNRNSGGYDRRSKNGGGRSFGGNYSSRSRGGKKGGMKQTIFDPTSLIMQSGVRKPN